MTRRCIQLKLHCFNFSFEDSQLITECQKCLNCLFHQARCLWMRKCLQIICSRYVALISGICSESTKSHSPEEQVFISMNSSQDEEKSHNTGLVFLNAYLCFHETLIRSIIFLKESDRTISRAQGSLMPTFSTQELRKVSSATFEQFSCNFSCACFVLVFPNPPA